MMRLEERTRHYKLLEKKPLEIKIFLGTPLVLPDNGIHLDSLLTEIVARELFGHDKDRWQNQDKHIELPLPLEKSDGKSPVWNASIGFTSTLVREHQDFWVKRTNDEFSAYISTQVVWPAGVISENVSKSLAKELRLEHATGPANSSASGGFKSYYESRNLVTTDYLIFHAFGNLNEVARLLNVLQFIGKKTAIGFGKITKVEVAEVEQDYSLFTPEGKPARSLPVEDYPNIKSQMVASPIMPPYWSKRNLVLCHTPTSPIPIWQWSEQEASNSFEEDWFDELEESEDWFDD